ncbi:MAG: membrane protein insertase YidC [Verrucomicrobia bacterium]|nr:membrane protein insertase YidC [Verrucomicrobiota bacterium]
MPGQAGCLSYLTCPMDRKSFFVLILCFALLMLWYPLVNKIFPPTPAPPGTNTVSTATKGTGTPSAAATATAPTTNLKTSTIATPQSQPVLAPRSDEPEKLLTLENENVRCVFSSHFGGLQFVELKKYPATVDCRGKNRAGTNKLATLNAPKPVLPAMTLLGDPALESDGIFALSQIGSGVRAEKLLSNGLHLVKEFQLSTNYLLKANLRLENRTTQPIALPTHHWVIGTATPLTQHDESIMLGVQWFDGKKEESVGEPWFANRPLGCLPGTPRPSYIGGASNVFWAAVHNQFFALVAIPSEPAPMIFAQKINLPVPSAEEVSTDSRIVARPFGYQAALVYPQISIAPNQQLERRFDIYAGPKEYNTLARLGNKLDLIMKFGFFGFFAQALLLSMNGLYHLGLSYGLAIVAITVIIKLLFWPLTNASTRSMKRMAALQPQMKAIQEKYKDDPKKMNLKLMEFMKENKVSPLGGCLPLLLQIPVFIGFYTMLQSAIELRGAKFLWACDLSQADTIAVIPGLGFPINPMPLLMGATMLWQARLTPPSPGMDPVQQKIMKYMPLMFMVFLYNFSAGLTLYWTVQNLLTITQMKLTKTSDPHAAAGAKSPSPAPKGPAPKKQKPTNP